MDLQSVCSVRHATGRGSAAPRIEAIRATLAVVLLSVLVASVADAGPREAITESNAVLCDAERRVCLRGSLSYYSNPRLLRLRSRVLNAVDSGLVKIRVVGEDSTGYPRYTTLEIWIRGRPSEIANAEVITDHPDVEDWQLDSVSFEPGPLPDEEYP